MLPTKCQGELTVHIVDFGWLLIPFLIALPFMAIIEQQITKPLFLLPAISALDKKNTYLISTMWHYYYLPPNCLNWHWFIKLYHKGHKEEYINNNQYY